jgi:hypothetical protein
MLLPFESGPFIHQSIIKEAAAIILEWDVLVLGGEVAFPVRNVIGPNELFIEHSLLGFNVRAAVDSDRLDFISLVVRVRRKFDLDLTHLSFVRVWVSRRR